MNLNRTREGGYSLVVSPRSQNKKALYPYDYGYHASQKLQRTVIEVQPGQNLHGLGAKLEKDSNNIPQQRTRSQLKANDEVVSISEIKSETVVPPPSPKETKVQYVERKAKLFKRSEKGVKVFQAGHHLFDPIEYMQDHNIPCRKFNYSVPQSYNDISVVLSATKDAKFLNVYNIEGFELQKNKFQRLQNPINSIELSKITGFIYGAFSTRFWMLRLGVNQRIVDNLY